MEKNIKKTDGTIMNQDGVILNCDTIEKKSNNSCNRLLIS